MTEPRYPMCLHCLEGVLKPESGSDSWKCTECLILVPGLAVYTRFRMQDDQEQLQRIEDHHRNESS